MKRLFLAVIALALILSMSSCDENAGEKIQDALDFIFNDLGKDFFQAKKKSQEFSLINFWKPWRTKTEMA